MDKSSKVLHFVMEVDEPDKINFAETGSLQFSTEFAAFDNSKLRFLVSFEENKRMLAI